MAGSASAAAPKFSVQHGHHGYRLHVSSRPLELPRALAKELAEADAAYLVGGGTIEDRGQVQLLLAVSSPSRQDRTAGYCGAGTEDELVLLKFEPPASARLLDVLPLQSCLHDFLLDAGQGADLQQMLGRVTDPTRFELSWEAHPQYGEGAKHIEIRNGKFFVR